jgi:hypothetical protein
LTKTFIGFGFFERWVSRSAMWMPLTPTFWHQLCAQPRGRLRLVVVKAEVGGDVEERLLDEPGHHARIGAAAGNGGDAAGIFLLLLQHAFRAAHSWCARRSGPLLSSK